MSIRKPKLEDFPYFNQGINFSSDIAMQFMVPGCRTSDCIPSIDDPVFVDKNQALDTWDATDQVLVMTNPNDLFENYAFPKRVLDLHEIVNFDFNDGSPVAITYCPLCDSSAAYSREINGDSLEFGVSGLLYHSAVIIFDRYSDSLFSQMQSSGIHGKYKGMQLGQLPCMVMTLEQYFQYSSNGLCLSDQTGFPNRKKKYKEGAYQEYRSNQKIMFPFKRIDDLLDPKHRVMHFTSGKHDYILDMKKIQKGSTYITDDIYTQRLGQGVLLFSGEIADGINWKKWVPSTISYYFAARAYYPSARVI